MAERKPWICPRCDVVVAPHADTHRCDPDGGVTAKVPPPGGGGPDPVSVTVTGAAWPQTWAAGPPAPPPVVMTFGSGSGGTGGPARDIVRRLADRPVQFA